MNATKNVIVTGGAGFIGSKLVLELVKLGHKVLVIDNFSTGKISNLAESNSEIEIISENIANFEKINQKTKPYRNKISAIFHLAALPRIERSLDNPKETHQSNVDGVFGVLELAKFLGTEKLIYTSSSSVYGIQKKNPLSEKLTPNPLNPYAAHKLIGEVYCDLYSKVFGIPIVTLRLFNVYGRGMAGKGAYQLVFTKWIEQIKKGMPLTIYDDGKQTRDFTHVSDAVKAMVRTMDLKQKKLHEIINIGASRQVSVNYLASLFGARVVYVEGRKFEERFKQADIRKAKRLLSFSPKVSIEEGVAELLKAAHIKI